MVNVIKKLKISVYIFIIGFIIFFSKFIYDNYLKYMDFNINNNYIGVLEIKKINLRKGFHDIGDINNNVSKGIQVISKFNWPDYENSMLILASHSGNSRISYFNKLDKLEYGDIVSIYYGSKKYKYRIIDIVEVLKKGNIEISENINNSLLILITCSKIDEFIQLIYICEIIEIL